mmetsp:Transcript_46773/g.99971  ORF Transcript_46773/g.99971 Transcript_46773/m.99971 type:complete len:235 (+) Transcript_46773:320-1024(+)
MMLPFHVRIRVCGSFRTELLLLGNHRADLRHKVLQRAQDCLLQCHGALWAAPAGPTKAQHDLPRRRLEAQQIHIAAVVLDARPHPMLEDLGDLPLNAASGSVTGLRLRPRSLRWLGVDLAQSLVESCSHARSQGLPTGTVRPGHCNPGRGSACPSTLAASSHEDVPNALQLQQAAPGRGQAGGGCGHGRPGHRSGPLELAHVRIWCLHTRPGAGTAAQLQSQPLTTGRTARRGG